MPGFVALASALSGSDASADWRGCLRAVAASGLSLPAELGLVHRSGPFPAAHPCLVFAAAAALVGGQDEVDVADAPPDREPMEWAASRVRGSAAAAALVAERYAPRCFSDRRGFVVLHAHREGIAAVACLPTYGAPVLDAREVPMDDCDAVVDASSPLLALPSAQPGSAQDALRRMSRVDLRAATADVAWRLWERGFPAKPANSPGSRVGVDPVGVLLAMTLSRAGSLGGDVVATLSVRKADPIPCARALAYRRLARAMGPGPVARAALLVDKRGDYDPVSLAAAHAFASGFRNPERLVQALESDASSVPILRAAVAYSRLPGAFRARLLRYCASVDGGMPPPKALRDAVSDVLGAPVANAVAASLSRAALPAQDALSYVTVSRLQAVLGRHLRHRVLRKEETVALLADAADVEEALSEDGCDARGPGFPLSAHYVALACDAARRERGTFAPLPDGTVDALRWLRERSRDAGAPDAPAAALGLVFPKGRKGVGLDGFVAEWHRSAPALDAAFLAARARALSDRAGRLAAAAAFPPFGGYPVPDGMAARRLDTEAACVAEGVSMDHCVATFSDRAAAGDVFILAVEDPHGRSTASFALRRSAVGEWRLVADQVRSRGNADAPASHLAFAEGVVAWASAPPVTEGILRGVREARRLLLAARTDGDDSPETRERVADAAFEALRPFVPKRARKGTRTSWLASLVRLPPSVAVPDDWAA